MKVIKYTSLYYDEWNNFIATAKNATFLFHRDFMEYHSDRFEDYSLLVYKKEKLVALLPANKKEDAVYSHQGLTYGGLILDSSQRSHIVLSIFENLLKYLFLNEIKELEIKFIPAIYHKVPSDELLFLMYILDAKLMKREMLSVINLDGQNSFKSRIEGYKRAEKHKLKIKEDKKCDAFWNEILIPNLRGKYNAKPVHSLEEINKLKSLFPESIRQFNVYLNDNIVAGATIFESEKVVRLQYISANKDKSTLGSLDYLQIFLLKYVFTQKKYFDLGTSKKEGDKTISNGLLFWKEGFGARALTCDVYKVDTVGYGLLSDIIR
ncbi:GNAT family N-acetyltransferase [Snuella sedimenti]|uniref:GNAT family N-acetyltransferase n=1 Tax=Snuella sedimenti TaxID=2798802 RepID=A0A8J7J5Q6_9FLAO|nr:GNAT family N-acetyltransferase [Snuella sedimenti]MBJ6369293.1 GNAT family N-acetyltransferase [Snuella sedimenti]